VQYAKGPVEELGLLKMDFLGLKTLTVIADAQENIRRTADPTSTSRKCRSTTRRLTTCSTPAKPPACSSWNPPACSLCRQIGLSKLRRDHRLIALYRPGPMQFIPDYVEGKKDPARIQIPAPAARELFPRPTASWSTRSRSWRRAIIAGYTLGGADMLRRAMGKKDAEAWKGAGKFVAGREARTNGISQRKAEEIFDILEKFARIRLQQVALRRLRHVVSYQTAYLKANYPVQFMAAVLSAELGNADKVAHFIEECSSMGHGLGPVSRSRDVNESRQDVSAFWRPVRGSPTGGYSKT
jgi:DNA polymerase III subunit alpha